MSNHSRRILFVGNLPVSVREREVEDLFSKYGSVRNVELQTRGRPPCRAFVEFEEARDAEDAICGCKGRIFGGCRLKVELDHRRRGHPSSLHRPRSNNRRSGRSGSVSRRSNYQVTVTGLPSSCIMAKPRGTMGIVDYSNYDDMKNAIRKLDDSEFKNAFSRVKEYGIKRSLSRSRRRSRSRSYSRSRSPRRSKSFKSRPAHRSSTSRSRSASSRSRSGSKGRSSLSSSSGSRPRSRSPVTSPRIKRTSQSPKKRSPSGSRPTSSW